MSDWQAGDLALCVLDDWEAHTLGTTPKVRPGGIYTVTAVLPFYNTSYLQFAEHESGAYAACGFVKITPGTEITGKEVEAKRPVKVPA